MATKRIPIPASEHVSGVVQEMRRPKRVRVTLEFAGADVSSVVQFGEAICEAVQGYVIVNESVRVRGAA